MFIIKFDGGLLGSLDIQFCLIESLGGLAGLFVAVNDIFGVELASGLDLLLYYFDCALVILNLVLEL
jgi:hypothetical protein